MKQGNGAGTETHPPTHTVVWWLSTCAIAVLAFLSAMKAMLLKLLLAVVTTHTCLSVLDSNKTTGIKVSNEKEWSLPYVVIGSLIITSTLATALSRDFSDTLNDAAKRHSFRIRAIDLAYFNWARVTDLFFDSVFGALTMYFGYLLHQAQDKVDPHSSEDSSRAITIRLLCFVLPTICWTTFTTGAYDSVRASFYCGCLQKQRGLRLGGRWYDVWRAQVRPFILMVFTSRAAELSAALLAVAEIFIVVYLIVVYVNRWQSYGKEFDLAASVFDTEAFNDRLEQKFVESPCALEDHGVNISTLSSTGTRLLFQYLSPNTSFEWIGDGGISVFASCSEFENVLLYLLGIDAATACNGTVAEVAPLLESQWIALHAMPESTLGSACALTCAIAVQSECTPPLLLDFFPLREFVEAIFSSGIEVHREAETASPGGNQQEQRVNLGGNGAAEAEEGGDTDRSAEIQILEEMLEEWRRYENYNQSMTLAGSDVDDVYWEGLDVVLTRYFQSLQDVFLTSGTQKTMSILLAVVNCIELVLEWGRPTFVGGVIDVVVVLATLLGMAATIVALNRIQITENAGVWWEATVCVGLVHCVLVFMNIFGRMARKFRRLPMHIWNAPANPKARLKKGLHPEDDGVDADEPLLPKPERRHWSATTSIVTASSTLRQTRACCSSSAESGSASHKAADPRASAAVGALAAAGAGVPTTAAADTGAPTAVDVGDGGMGGVGSHPAATATAAPLLEAAGDAAGKGGMRGWGAARIRDAALAAHREHQPTATAATAAPPVTDAAEGPALHAAQAGAGHATLEPVLQNAACAAAGCCAHAVGIVDAGAVEIGLYPPAEEYTSGANVGAAAAVPDGSEVRTTCRASNPRRDSAPGSSFRKATRSALLVNALRARKRLQEGDGAVAGAGCGGPERPLPSMSDSTRPLRILCIDGGGVKGLNPTLVLKAIEDRLGGRPVREMFDLICGTSIGAAMAMVISLGASLDTGVAILREMAETRVMVKSSSIRLLTTGSKISSSDLDPMVVDTVAACGVPGDPQGPPAPRPSSSEHVPHFFMTTCCMDKAGSWAAYINSNYERSSGGRRFQTDGSDEWPLFQRMRAAVAAPTFFPPLIKDGTHYVDAAIVANNPTLLAIKEAQNLWPGRLIGTVISLGCGKVSNRDARTPRSGLTYWAGQLLSMPMEVYRVHKDFQASLPYINGAGAPPLYFRLEPPTGEYELDESRAKVLDQMCKKTKAYVRRKSLKLDRLALSLHMLTEDQAASPNELLQDVHATVASEPVVRVAMAERGLESHK